MNKLTCRGCGKELENCTCDVLTTKKEQTDSKLPTVELIKSDKPCLKCRDYSEITDKANKNPCRVYSDRGMCRKYSESMGFMMGTMAQYFADREVENNLQKLNGELRERIKELEELILTKDEALWLLGRIGIAKYFIINRYAVAKLQKIAGQEVKA